MMKGLLSFVAAAVVTSGFAYGGESSQIPEQLKGLGPFIGTWRYEGPSLEDVTGVAKKGSECVVQFSWKRILEKKVVLQDLLATFEGNKKISQKELIGWNAADREIVIGGMNSLGEMLMGTIQLDRQAKTITVKTEGVNAAGKKMGAVSVFTKVDKDTLTFQRKQMFGSSVVEGPSPVYTLQRVKRTTAKTAAK